MRHSSVSFQLGNSLMIPNTLGIKIYVPSIGDYRCKNQAISVEPINKR